MSRVLDTDCLGFIREVRLFPQLCARMEPVSVRKLKPGFSRWVYCISGFPETCLKTTDEENRRNGKSDRAAG